MFARTNSFLFRFLGTYFEGRMDGRTNNMDGLIYSDVCWLWWTNGHRRTQQPNQLLGGGGGGVDVNIAGPR